MKFKVQLLSVFFICSVFFGISHAREKVVVIPLASTQTNIYGGGWINQDGSITTKFGRPFTVQHGGGGLYAVNLPNLRPNCVGPMPIAQATVRGSGNANISSSTIGSNFDTGDTGFSIQTTTNEGLGSDKQFSVIIMLSESFSECAF
jgi:hypothetical protein